MRGHNRIKYHFTDTIRLEQLLILIAAIIYCLAIFFDILILKIPLPYFEIIIVVVGIGYLISSSKSMVIAQTIIIGVLWISVGIITGVNLNFKFVGIPIAIIGSSAEYFLIMCMTAITIIQRRDQYINNAAFVVVASFAFLMAITHVIAFLGIGVKMGYFDFMNNIFLPIGETVIRFSSYSIMELMSMLVVIFSILPQAPMAFYFDDDEEY